MTRRPMMERECAPVLFAAAATMAISLLAGAGALAQEGQRTRPAAIPDPPAQFAVSPGKFEIPIGSKAAVESVQLINFSDREVEIRVSVATWDLDEGGRVRHLESTEQTLDQWLVFNPSHFTVPPRSAQTVRFAIRPRVQPAPGEHRAMIYFEEVPRQQAGHSFQVVFRVGVAVYAYAGEVHRRGELNALEVVSGPGLLRAAFDISSEGNVHVRLNGQYAVWPLERFPGVASIAPLEGIERPDFVAPEPIRLAGVLPNTPVLPGTRRRVVLATHHTLAPGRYVLVALGKVGEESFRRVAEFVVPPAAPLRVAGQGPGGSQ